MIALLLAAALFADAFHPLARDLPAGLLSAHDDASATARATSAAGRASPRKAGSGVNSRAAGSDATPRAAGSGATPRKAGSGATPRAAESRATPPREAGSGVGSRAAGALRTAARAPSGPPRLAAASAGKSRARFAAPVQAALRIDDPSGLRAFLEHAGQYARSLSPAEVSRSFVAQVGVDALAQPGTLVFAQHATGFIATGLAPAEARRLLAEFKRPFHSGVFEGGRLLTASGRDASALLAAMRKSAPDRRPAQPHAALARVGELWAALAPPLREVSLTLEASGNGLRLHGPLDALAPIVQRPAPPACDTQAFACLSVGLAPAGRELIARLFERLRLPPPRDLATADRLAARLDDLDAGALHGLGSLARALHYALATPGAALSNPPDAPPLSLVAPADRPDAPASALPAPGEHPDAPPSTNGAAPSAQRDAPSSAAALTASLDLARLDARLSALSPIDALTGELAAQCYALHLLYGPLLAHTGPLTVVAEPAANGAAAAEMVISLPLR